MAKGAHLEYVSVSRVSPTLFEQPPAELAEWVAENRGENIILSSDLGQGSGPPHPEGIRMLLRCLLDEGVPPEYLERMVHTTPHTSAGSTANEAEPFPSPLPLRFGPEG